MSEINPGNDRITRIVIMGVRTLEHVSIELEQGAPTVLIGSNGVGKSSVVEVFAILQALSSPHFVNDFARFHGGVGSLLRQGEPELEASVVISGSAGRLSYSVAIARSSSGPHATITREAISTGPREVVDRTGAQATVLEESSAGSIAWVKRSVEVGPAESILAAVTLGPNPAVARVRRALEAIDVHVAIDVRPSWAAREVNSTIPTREPSMVQPTTRLERFGGNLPSALFELRNRSESWPRVLDWIRLGLGDDVLDVQLPVDGGGGRIGLALRLRSLKAPVPSHMLSDGMLSYIALVAAMGLARERCSAFVIDEPEAHLHPALVARLSQLLRELAADVPVLIATQSDHLLDALGDASTAARCTRVLELDERRATKVRRLDDTSLKGWLESYRGLGDLRSAGLMDLALHDDPASAP